MLLDDLDPAPVTFSSGAPGSAQATGGTNGTGGATKPNGAVGMAVSGSQAFLMAGSALLALAGFSILL